MINSHNAPVNYDTPTLPAQDESAPHISRSNEVVQEIQSQYTLQQQNEFIANLIRVIKSKRQTDAEEHERNFANLKDSIALLPILK